MAELFESYEGDFASLTSGIKEKLDKDAKVQKGEQRKATLRRLDMEVDEADEIISQMDIELQGFPQSVKPRYQVKLRGYRAELGKIKEEVRTQLASSDRSELLGYGVGGAGEMGDLEAGHGGEEGYAQAQRTRLLSGTETLQDGSRRLEDSQRVALETEELGGEILSDLRSQREQIEASRDTLHGADSNLDKASKTLKKMIRRMKQQRMITIAIIVVLILLIVVIVYSKLH